MKFSKTKRKFNVNKGIIKFKDDKLYVKCGKHYYYPELLNNDDKVTLYSLPSNTAHDIGFSTLIDTNSYFKNYDIISKYWSIVKEGMKVKGYIKDDKFIINFKL